MCICAKWALFNLCIGGHFLKTFKTRLFYNLCNSHFALFCKKMCIFVLLAPLPEPRSLPSLCKQ